MTVNEKMIGVVKKNEQLAYNTALGLKGCQQDYISGSYQETTQAVINAAWNKFDADDKSTWPNGECYEYQCLVRGWKDKMIVGKAWQIDKWDHVLAYIEPEHIMPDMQLLYVRKITELENKS